MLKKIVHLEPENESWKGIWQKYFISSEVC